MTEQKEAEIKHKMTQCSFGSIYFDENWPNFTLCPHGLYKYTVHQDV